jgi:hypothetical protein
MRTYARPPFNAYLSKCGKNVCRRAFSDTLYFRDCSIRVGCPFVVEGNGSHRSRFCCLVPWEDAPSGLLPDEKHALVWCVPVPTDCLG